MALAIIKAGYYGGNLETLYNAPVDHVMNIFNYEAYMIQYQETEMKLNEKKD